MSGLNYVGAPPATSPDIVNKLAVSAQIAITTPNQASVQGQIDVLTSGGSPTYATKSYVDTQDATFQPISYYQSQDALNVPTTSRGVASGVASLDGTTKVPIAQIPVLGAGYLRGPYGTTAQPGAGTGAFPQSTASTPIKIADINIGVSSLLFQPLVFCSAFVTGTALARPVIEVRIANSTSSTTYAASTLVAMGVGRNLYADYHAITVVPVGSTTGTSPASLATNYNVWLTVWLYDANNDGVTIATGLSSCSVFLARQAA